MATYQHEAQQYRLISASPHPSGRGTVVEVSRSFETTQARSLRSLADLRPLVGKVVEVSLRPGAQSAPSAIFIDFIAAASPKANLLETADPRWLPSGRQFLYRQFSSLVGQLDPIHQRLIASVFKDEETLRKFLDRPASLNFHHNWKGGLFEHTVDVATECAMACSHRPCLNLNLAVTAGLLHDIGKIEEYEPGARGGYRRSAVGELEMHKISGVKIIAQAAMDADIPRTILASVLHCVTAAHGPEYMGLARPKNPEANIVQTSDSRSSFCPSNLRTPNKQLLPHPTSRAARYSSLARR